MLIMMMIMMRITLMMKILHLKELNGDPLLQCHEQLWQFSVLKIEFLRSRLLSIFDHH